MSAICAAYRWDGQPLPAARAELLLAGMREYGEGGSVWGPGGTETPVALGCIPWRVTPEDEWHHGPIRSSDGNVVVVADARIDNREDLAAELSLSPERASAMPDAGFVLAAWQRWGHACAARLIGDFAFVVWDARTHELFCARDAIGQRVLFYHEFEHGIAVATTAHALTCLPDVHAELDEQKVADFLVLLPRADNTFFRGIRRLEPGHALIAGRAGVRIERYWSPVPSGMLRLASDEEYVRAFLEQFEAAVRSQLRCAGTVAVMASGGLDSSSVAAVAARQLREQGRSLLAFHAAPREGFAGPVRRDMVADESGDVEALARMHPNIDLHIRRTDGGSPLDDLETSFRMTGAPPRNPANAPWFLDIYAKARAAGARVMLSGHKGNATISQTGLRSLRDSAVRLEWRRVWRETQALARTSGQGRRDVFQREVVQPLVPRALGAALRRRTSRKTVWDDTSAAINPAFARAMGVEERIRAANRHHEDMHRLSEMNFRLMVLAGGVDVFDLYSGFRPWFGIETRDPTADRRVVEFCMAIPGSQFLRNGETRSLIRRAMIGLVPDEIRLRPTHGAQSADWTEWLPTIRGELRSELEALAQSETAMRCLDLPRMRQLVDNWPERLRPRHDRDYLLLLLRGVTMGRFIRWFESTYA